MLHGLARDPGDVRIGRPLAGIVISIYMMFPSSIADFATLRFFNGALLIGLSYWCYVIFAGLSERHRFRADLCLSDFYSALRRTLDHLAVLNRHRPHQCRVHCAVFTLVNKAYAKMGATRALLAAAGYIILLATTFSSTR